MNKKAIMMLKIPIYLIISLVVGVLVIAGFISLTNRGLNNLAEQITAKDIGLTIMTISASPYDMVYMYDKNTEPYEISIADGKIKVTSKKGVGEYTYFPMKGIKVEDAILTHVLTVPLNLKKGVLSFSDQTVNYMDACAQIPLTFDGDKIKVKITIDDSDILVANKLNEINSVMHMYATNVNSAVEFVDYGEDLSIELGTTAQGVPQIMYYADMQDASFSWYHRIACYAKNGIDANGVNLGNANLLSISEEKIRVDFGNTNEFLAKTDADKSFTARTAKELYDAIARGISS
jgi:hypothetical protein